MGASLARFIPTNEAGAPFAGDATGLRWCVVAVGVTVWTGGTTVSRAFHARSPRISAQSEFLGPMGDSLNPSMRTLTP